MVAVVSGTSLGLSLSSLATLGQRGIFGTAANGRAAEGVYVNAATGNLVLRDHDDTWAGHGLNAESYRTYNSLGLLTDDNSDNWSMGFYTNQVALTGTVNTAGSTVVRTDRDGAQATYAYDAATGKYRSTAGAGAYDTIVFQSGAGGTYIWTDGDTGLVERYGGLTGRLESTTDVNGNALTYNFGTGARVTSIIDSSNQTSTYYDYTAGKLMQIRTVGVGGLTRVRYTYDGLNRLSTVTVDLTPADGSIADGKTYVTTG